MTDSILLHQYEISPFSEKVRVVFGIMGLEWYAVDQPVIMPKPDLVCLTGGYRKIPVLQIGADIYCDTQIIVDELNRRFAARALPDAGGLGTALGFWSDRVLFQAVVAVIFGSIGAHVDDAFKKDREAMTGRPFDTDQMKQAVPVMTEQVRAHFGLLDGHLADGRAFLGGDRAGLADAHAYYNIWFMRATHPAAATSLVDGFSHLPLWEQRVKALGHGTRHDMPAAEAIRIAKQATSTTQEHLDPHEPNGLTPGTNVQVMADDYGRDPIRGTLVASSATAIAIRRTDPQVGEVVVHVPRAGFWVVPA